MIIRIPIMLEDVGMLADLELHQTHHCLLNTDDISYVIPQDGNAVIFLKSGMMTDDEVEIDMSHCHLVAALSVDELYAEINRAFLTQN